ncbi:MAG: nucleotidyltransferase domain-containing protein [Planctomycetia bacterium]
MRLSPAQRERILRIVRESAGIDASVWLYGSRIHDDRRGGDVDLLVQSSLAIDVQRQAAMHARLEEELLLPVDISFIDPRLGMTRFQKLAATQALPLEAAR